MGFEKVTKILHQHILPIPTQTNAFSPKVNESILTVRDNRDAKNVPSSYLANLLNILSSTDSN